MKSRFALTACLAVVATFCVPLPAAAAVVHYVAPSNSNPVPPYTSWGTAATNIQHAIDAAGSGDEVVVTNGVYRTGGQEVYSVMNRVALTKPVTVRSVNGPAVTVIEGNPVIGDEAVRCAYLGDGAVLAGFTLTKGATRDFIWWPSSNYGRVWGGGVWCEYPGAVVSNCVITGNSSKYLGGGAYGGLLIECSITANSGWYGGGACSNTLVNCTLSTNSAYTGGGATGCEMSNCTLTGNSSVSGGGADQCRLRNCVLLENVAEDSGGGAAGSTLVHCTLTGNRAAVTGGGTAGSLLTNCIVYYNMAPAGPNVAGSSLEFCCSSPLPKTGQGNFNAVPRLVDGFHLSADSPCRGRGNPVCAAGQDIDGEPWLALPSVGSDEYHSGSTTGALEVSIQAGLTHFAADFPVDFAARIKGRTSAHCWDFGDGIVVSNSPYVSHAWVSAGVYQVTLTAYNETYPAGVRATTTVQVAPGSAYVSLSSATPQAPFTSWTTAATNIQDAVDTAPIGATIWVSNGLYQVGGRAVQGGIANRLAVDKVVTVRSLNGPAVTAIVGYQVPGTIYGAQAVRCVYLTNGAVLSGFTLTNGSTADPAPEPPAQLGSGGGVWCQSASALVSNCVVAGNWGGFGGGASGGTFKNCRFTDNHAWIGGAISGGALESCLLRGNFALDYGGGAGDSTLNNCTLADNVAGDSGGGAFESTLVNCIVYGNQPENYYYNCTFRYCCTTPLPESGAGNFTNAPLFVNAAEGNFQLQTGSPCINAGTVAEAPAGA